MAKGKAEYEARQSALNLLGKDLARRAKSKCELCEEGGKALSVAEVPPAPKVPDIDCCVMICEDCSAAVSDPKRFRAGENWRVLTKTVWSDIPAVQVLAVRLMKRQSDSQSWAGEALDGLFLDEAVEKWVTEAG